MWVRSNHRPATSPLSEPSWGQVVATTVKLWLRRRPTARRWLLAAVFLALAVVTVAVLQVSGVFVRTAGPAGRVRATADTGHGMPLAAQAEAVAWIASQVSNAAMVGCYPVMCAALQAQGVPAGRLVPVQPGSADQPRAQVVVTSASAGRQLADRYAPALIASFGSGGSRIEVRATEPGGAAAYWAAQRADLAARKSAGAQLLRNRHLLFTPPGAAQLLAGQVDSRLLATLAALSSQYQFQVTVVQRRGSRSSGAVPADDHQRGPDHGPGRGTGHGARSELAVPARARRDCPAGHRSDRAEHRIRRAEPARAADGRAHRSEGG